MKVKTKKNLHFLRKLWHMLPGLILSIILLNGIISQDRLQSWFIKATIIVIVSDYLRLRNKKLNRIFIKYFGLVIRREEFFAPSGIGAYVGAISIVLFFFPTQVAVLSILFLAFGDPFASFCGIFFKEHPVNYRFENGKSLFGLFGAGLACLVVTLVAGLFVFKWPISLSYAVGSIGGTIVGFVETFQPKEYNDNLIIPIVSAFSIQTLLTIMQ